MFRCRLLLCCQTPGLGLSEGGAEDFLSGSHGFGVVKVSWGDLGGLEEQLGEGPREGHGPGLRSEPGALYVRDCLFLGMSWPQQVDVRLGSSYSLCLNWGIKWGELYLIWCSMYKRLKAWTVSGIIRTLFWKRFLNRFGQLHVDGVRYGPTHWWHK